MVDDLSEKPEPAAQGTLEKSPFPHLLVYAYDRQLLGTMEFEGPTGETATVLFIEGCPVKARTSEAVAYLGAVLLEMGFVSEAAVKFSLRRLAEEKRLHGQILLEAGSITQEQLVVGLRTQLARKLEHLCRMPPETTFVYYDAFDGLAGYGGDEDASLDPYPLVWNAIRQEPSWEHVSNALTKVGSFGLRIGPETETDRFAFEPDEQRVIAMLRQRPWRMHELTAAGALSPSMTQLIVYCLLITKQVEVVRESLVPPAPGAAPIVEPEPPSSKNPLPEASPSGTQVARMKLQALQVKNRPAAVEARAEGLPWDRRQTPPAGIPAQTDPGPAAAAPPPPPAPVPVPARAPVPPAVIPHATAPASKPPKPAPIDAHALPPLPFDDPPSPASPPIAPQAPVFAPFGPPAAASAPPPAPVVALSPEHAARKAEISEKAAAIAKQNYFEMLGISRDSTPEQATTAYFTLAKKWHPDRVPPALRESREECARVFTHLSEAHQTLTDKEKRARYMNLLKDGGATPEAQDQIVKVIEAATNFQKAEICLKRNDLAQAEEFCKKAIADDPQQAEYLALQVWLEAQKPANQGAAPAEGYIRRLTAAIAMNSNCERAYFYRGMLAKRVQRDAEAIKDFRRAYDLNPRNVDAQREVRLAEMRGAPGTTSAKKKKAEEEKGGLFGKLFKK
jgi:curved DNA-binding protein CbpA